MAVNRWFFVLRAGHGRERATGLFAQAGYDYYIHKIEIVNKENDGAAMDFKIIGNQYGDLVNTLAAPIVSSLFREPYLYETNYVRDVWIKLNTAALGGFFYISCDNLGTSSGYISVKIHVLKVPTSSSTILSRDVLLKALAHTNNIVLEGNADYPNGTAFYLNVNANFNSYPIVQPMQQATPAVADELQVVGSAFDTSDGVGARTIAFKYINDSFVEVGPYTITMTGATPVDIISLYDDVLWISEVYTLTCGAFGRNYGDIYFQDAPGE